MKFLAFCILSIILAIQFADACKISVRIRSESTKKFRVQVFVPSTKQKTERILFAGKEEKKAQIEGANCMAKRWIVRTWKSDQAGQWVPAKQATGHVDGNGWMRIVVRDDLMPIIHDRMGIMCSSGNLCG